MTLIDDDIFGDLEKSIGKDNLRITRTYEPFEGLSTGSLALDLAVRTREAWFGRGNWKPGPDWIPPERKAE